MNVLYIFQIEAAFYYGDDRHDLMSPVAKMPFRADTVTWDDADAFIGIGFRNLMEDEYILEVKVAWENPDDAADWIRRTFRWSVDERRGNWRGLQNELKTKIESHYRFVVELMRDIDEAGKKAKCPVRHRAPVKSIEIGVFDSADSRHAYITVPGRAQCWHRADLFIRACAASFACAAHNGGQQWRVETITTWQNGINWSAAFPLAYFRDAYGERVNFSADIRDVLRRIARDESETPVELSARVQQILAECMLDDYAWPLDAISGASEE